MEPGAVMRTLNHSPLVVVTLCAAGEPGYRHLESHGTAPPSTQIDGSEFTIRETRNGMRAFVAGAAGARLVDFTLALTEDTSTFSYLRVSPQPTDLVRDPIVTIQGVLVG